MNPLDIFSNRGAWVSFTGEFSRLEELISGVIKDVTVDFKDKKGFSS